MKRDLMTFSDALDAIDRAEFCSHELGELRYKMTSDRDGFFVDAFAADDPSGPLFAFGVESDRLMTMSLAAFDAMIEKAVALVRKKNAKVEAQVRAEA